MTEQQKFAVFIDYDNIAIGVRHALNQTFQYRHIEDWINSKGAILTKIAYGNWSTDPDAKTVLRKFAQQGVRMEHLETASNHTKNGADIALALAALELVFTQPHIDAFCIVSGDSDFLPLVQKLKQNNKRVYIVASKSSISENLRRNCHEFVSYEELIRHPSARESTSRQTESRVRGRHGRPLEAAMPSVRRAIREMNMRGETTYTGQLCETVLDLEPDFDPRVFGCESMKDLIIDLEQAGYVWRKPIGYDRFCIADQESDFEPVSRSDPDPREARPRGRGGDHQVNGPPARRSKRSSAPPVPTGKDLTNVVSVMNQAITRIAKDGRLVELGMLYSTILEIDPSFRTYGSGRLEFQQFVGGLVLEGYFALKPNGRSCIVESTGKRPRAAIPEAPHEQVASTVKGSADDALEIILPVLRKHATLAGPGTKRNELREAVRADDFDFDCTAYGLRGFRDLLDHACTQGYLESRDDDGEGLRYFATNRLGATASAGGEQAAPNRTGGAARTGDRTGKVAPEEDSEPNRPQRKRRWFGLLGG